MGGMRKFLAGDHENPGIYVGSTKVEAYLMEMIEESFNIIKHKIATLH